MNQPVKKDDGVLDGGAFIGIPVVEVGMGSVSYSIQLIIAGREVSA